MLTLSPIVANYVTCTYRYNCYGRNESIEEFLQNIDRSGDLAKSRNIELEIGEHNHITGFIIYDRDLFLNEGLRLKMNPLQILTCKSTYFTAITHF